MSADQRFVLDYNDIGLDDVSRVGGKNASLGTLYRDLRRLGVGAVDGFATTAAAYRGFLNVNNLNDGLAKLFAGLDVDDVDALQTAGAAARSLILAAALPANLSSEVLAGLDRLRARNPGVEKFAVRSSATAEDLPEASFAGQQESFLNVTADDVVAAVQKCFASLFTDRAINYRARQGFDQLQVALSVGVQPMVHADNGSAGVMFTLDPDSGFRDVVVIDGSWGLGESVVQGRVTPDEWTVFKPSIKRNGRSIISRSRGSKETTFRWRADGSDNEIVDTDDAMRNRFCLSDPEVETLARWAVVIEAYFSERAGHPQPMDVEWARDGVLETLHILQARPETVHSMKDVNVDAEVFAIDADGASVLIEGHAVGEKIASGTVRNIASAAELDTVMPGDVLVSVMTNPDWEPVMKRVAAIVTDEGGRTAHAAIVSRELGVPCIVGARNATSALRNGMEVTVSCAEGTIGRVYEGRVPFTVEKISSRDVPSTRTGVMMNVGDPEQAFRLAAMPCDGVGLARTEFIITRHVGFHPMAAVRYPNLKDATAIASITARAGSEDPREYFVRCLSEGIARIAAAFTPRPVIVRTSDFKTNEYARLVGGEQFEPHEENPMIGFRGASRYYDPRYAEGFALECEAIARARNDMGLTNIIVMIPFCRTVGEARRVIASMENNGLRQGDNGLKVYAMCELPSNVIDAAAFLEIFDGYSIGSNDLTQLVLGVDRDAGSIAALFDETDVAVTRMIEQAISAAHAAGKPIGICGQAPSDHPDMLRMLVANAITSISVNPDVALRTKLSVSEIEKSDAMKIRDAKVITSDEITSAESA